MKYLFQRVKSLVFVAVLIFSSCSTSNQLACPTFETVKIKKYRSNKIRIKLFDSKNTLSIKQSQKTVREKPSNPDLEGGQIGNILTLKQDWFLRNDVGDPMTDETLKPTPTFAQNRNEGVGNSEFSNKRIQKQKRETIPNIKNMNTLRQAPKKNIPEPKKKIGSSNPNTSKRKTALVIGGTLLSMALLAGVTIPALGTLTASLGLIGIFILDVLVSLGIYNYHKKEKPKLAKNTAFLRLLYTAILGIGIVYHILGNVPMFNTIWGVGLIAFGIHLITLGILFNNEGGKRWVNALIKSLLIIAGIGYVIQYVGILVVANPTGFAALIESIFIVPMILGEVFYALWMLVKGGKQRKSEIKIS